MNDTELDQILNGWDAPPAPVSLRASVQAGFARYTRSKTSFGLRKMLLVVAALGIAGFLSIALAFPQTFQLVSIPYTVESECIQYSPDGSPAVRMNLTSYNQNGSEVVLESSLPGNPLGTMVRRALDAAGSLLSKITLPLVVNEDILERIKTRARISTGFEQQYVGDAAALVRAGCVNGPVIGRETILGHSTVAVQNSADHRRTTLWMAPDLSCFALKITIEAQRPGGAYRLLSTKQALRVTLNP